MIRRIVPGCLLFVVACADTPPGEQADAPSAVIARVGEESIDRREVEEFAASLLPGLRPEKGGDAARRDYLQTLIDEKLLVLEARRRGIDTTSAFQAGYQYAVRRHVVDQYERRHLHPLVSITGQEVRARLARDGLDRERLLSWIVVETEEQAARLRRRLEEGADFAELARLHSIDERFVDTGGEVGFVDGSVAGRAGIPVELFRELESGEVSELLSSRGAYLLVRFTREREEISPRNRRRARADLGKEKLAVERRALVEELAYESGLSLKPEGLAILVGKEPGGTSRPQLTPAEAAATLFTYEGGEITVGDYDWAFRHLGRKPGLGDSVAVVEAARVWVLPDIMIREAARKLGYHQTPSVLGWKKRKEVELLLMALRRTVRDQVEVSEEDARQFYLDHSGLFVESSQIWIQEILVDDPDAATAVRQRLESGEPFEDLAHLTERSGTEDGNLHLHGHQRARYGELVDRALAADVGQFVGPVQVPQGYSVFRVQDRRVGQLQPFAAAERRATASLRVMREEELFNSLVAEVREKYADQVRIFEPELRAMELPGDDWRQLAARDSVYGLGIAHVRKGRTAEAIEAFRAAIRIDSTFLPSYHDLALAHAAEGDFGAAYAEMGNAVRVGGEGSAYTHRLLAFFHSNQGRYEEAEKALWQAIEVDSSGAEARYELGVLYNKQGRPGEAESSLMRALRLNPAYKEAWNELGGLYTNAGRHDEADRALKRAVAIDSGYAQAYYNLSQLRSAQGQAEDATAMLKRFESLSGSPTR